MRSLFTLCLLLFTGSAFAADDYPHIILKNDKLKVKVYEVDAKKGFYRGTRFDHAGVFGEIEFAGHKIFGSWKDKHDPTNHDDVIGPCEEFGIEKPLGYDDAKVGETFLKIGVGELEKPKEDKYSFAKKYKIVKPAEWKRIEIPKDAFGRQELAVGWEMKVSHPSGYDYEYRKVIDLHRERPEVLIDHRLKNTGTKPITTDFYNHNFFNVDADPIGPNYSITFGFDVKPKDIRGKFAELVEVKGKELHFKEKLTEGFVMAELTGFDPEEVVHRGFNLRHAPSGVRVQVFQPQPFSKLKIWGMKTTICPEPFLAIELKPGEQKIWRIAYIFSHEPPKK
ncbi:MAG: hypothetical protein L0241_01370 [Planctomycetia bacterium]|nr:hypothetical protein [Planctomycetia bacterium]